MLSLNGRFALQWWLLFRQLFKITSLKYQTDANKIQVRWCVLSCLFALNNNIIIFIYFQLTLYNTWYEDNIIINNNYTISKLKECTRVIYYYTRKGGAFPVITIKRLVHIYVKKKKRKNKIMIIIKNNKNKKSGCKWIIIFFVIIYIEKWITNNINNMDNK